MITHIRSSEKDFHDVTEGLTQVLADSYILYYKTHHFHWNMTGPMTQHLHSVFEDQYLELATAVNEIGEHMRSISLPIPSSFAEYQGISSIKEVTGKIDALKMVQELFEGHQAIIKEIVPLVLNSHKAERAITAEILFQRLRSHEKAVQELRNHLDNRTIH